MAITLVVSMGGDWSIGMFHTDTPGVTASAAGMVSPVTIAISFPAGTFAADDILFADLPVLAPNAGVPSTVVTSFTPTVNGDGSATATLVTTAPTLFAFMLRVTAVTLASA